MFEFDPTYREIESRFSSEYAVKEFTKSLQFNNHYNPLNIRDADNGILFHNDPLENMQSNDADYFKYVNNFILGCFDSDSLEIIIINALNIFYTLKDCLPGYQYYGFMTLRHHYNNCKIYQGKDRTKWVKFDWIADDIFSLIAPYPTDFQLNSYKINEAIYNYLFSMIPVTIHGEVVNTPIDNLFERSDLRPKDLLIKQFNGREKVDMEMIGTICSRNPFMEIIAGEITEATEDNAIECLNDKKFSDAYEEMLNTNKNSKMAQQEITIFETHTPYCSLNQHCKVLGLRNHSIFANATAWKKLKENSPKKKRGNWYLFALPVKDLFELYTNYCIRDSMIAPGTTQALFNRYRGINDSD